MRGLLLACALCLLVGCAPLLERTYATAEPHSSRFWESEAAGTLRAESYQDIVNDLLLLIGQHTENATLRLYNFTTDFSVADTLERATTEIQQDTPMGAYAVEYITAVSQAQRGYYEVAVRISYRRSLEQIQAVVNATSPEALYSLLNDALDDGKTELAVRMGYWGSDGYDQMNAAILLVRDERGLVNSPDWTVSFFPSEDAPGLVEFLLDGGDALDASQNAGTPGGEPEPAPDRGSAGAPELDLNALDASRLPDPLPELDSDSQAPSDDDVPPFPGL